MPNVGYATLQVIPSVRGIADELRSQLVGPAEDAGEEAGQAAGGNLKDKLLAGAAIAGAAAGAVLVAGITEAMEQANITSVLKGQLGATGKDAARYGKIAGQLYAKGIVEDVQAGADAIRAVVQGGLVPPDATNKQLKSIAAQMADVATTFGTDMGLQSQAVSALLKNGLAPNAKTALGIITTGFQKLGPNAEDLLETFQEYPVQLKKLGLDAKTSLGLFQQGLKGGARDTDILADLFKEFSIRSIDMSQSSQDAYKALGLPAQEMSSKIAKGGASASAGLQTVLDKLREMKDPVAREAAAVGLFGTQAEEVGSALFKLDPSKATNAFGDMSGAAKQLGKDLHSGASHELEVFFRGLKQGFVTFLGGQVLPILSKTGSFLNSNVLPPMKTLGSILAVTLVPALRLTWMAGAATVNWLRDFGVWLIPAAIAVGGLTIALNAQAIATAFVTGVFSIYRAAILIGTAVTNGFAIAQGLLNAVMALNPFVLVAIALVALGAALVIAYKKSETFRTIVQAAFKAISVAALWLWDVVLKPVIGFIVKAFQWWWTAAKIYFTAVGVIFYTLGAVAVWLWESAISPVIGWIIAGFKLWWAGAKLYFSLVGAGFRAVGAAAMWLWHVAISPVIDLIVGGFKLWWAGVKIYFGFVRAGFRAVGAGATWLWKSAISPALSGIKSVIADGYNVGIRPVLDKLRAAVGKVGDAFRMAKDAIKVAWDKVKGIAKAPVVFVVNTVYGKLRGVWNTVAGAFGAPKLPAYTFATGGVLPGYTPGRDVHLAALSGGEAVMRPEWTRAVGPGYVNSMNAAARGGGIRGVQRALGLPGFADGGIFGWVKNTASKGVDVAKSSVSWLKDGMKASALAGINRAVKPLIERISGSASLYRDMITKVPEKMVKSLLSYTDTADKKLGAAGIGGKGFKSALSFAKSQAGKPYIWGGVGPAGYDCSGFMSAIENIIRGLKPYARRWATGAFSGSTAPSGWVRGARSPFRVGITNAGVGHTAGTLNGTNVESRGGDGVVVGSRARGYNDSLFTDWYGLKGYSKGTRGATPGWAWVGELGPELVRFGGGEEVLNHRDSLRAAGGMGVLPGYAKGTSKAKIKAARKDLPGDLTGVTKALTASASEIKRAFDALTKDLRAAGGAGKALAASSTKASAKLQALAKRRDSVDSRLEAAKSAAADQKKTAQDFFGLSQLGEVGTFSDLLGGLKSRQAEVEAFRKQIAGLSKKGVSQDIISQLVAQGPGGPLIDLIAGASKGQLAQLNKVSAAGGALSTSFGRTMADAMFDAGSQAGKGFLTGLQAQEAELQKAMDRLGAGLVAAIRKKLKIKSPSRVTQWVGEMTGAGVGVGLDNTAATVAAAAARVADAAVPGVPAVSPAGIASSASTPRGLTSGGRVYLVLEDGRELAAYVDDRADDRVGAGLNRVRRAASAGRKH
ncbi:replication protein [Streptomyces stelliscabiei]|uniref:Phage-related minor tail protein n=1 Tax=Streptomyces stelliscabiei TaxID=146820 RepID=A0A8I0PDJ2_9ACTN|nr:replication protein [Streptomyces stelliscabiei]KND30079.1 replication protein [Streptomyces stelliscabiei]MBE1599688.1 phage-related minor tail protein [Streptomyces stelliscabiei]MDX2519350.1 replication protein [Streptomyces stelliscabiei]MDX2549720.1 replication protein [Streptomyces stelliscabiei]MDX2616151.1 replication protein [Streptomyces stelliscabiei]